jgi:hypothetical protein
VVEVVVLAELMVRMVWWAEQKVAEGVVEAVILVQGAWVVAGVVVVDAAAVVVAVVAAAVVEEELDPLEGPSEQSLETASGAAHLEGLVVA